MAGKEIKISYFQETFMEKQSIIIPYYKNSDQLQYTLNLVSSTVPASVEIIVVANNPDKRELDICVDTERVKVIKIPQALLYSKAANIGVEAASGKIITLMDQDIFPLNGWYDALLDRFHASDNIGAVSAKMLNPANGRILEFGIEYAPNNSAHIAKDLPANHPLTMHDIPVSSACGGVLMTSKDLYCTLGGMDLDMPYICCDCDFTLKLWEINKEVWIASNAVVYHKSYTSSKHGKISDFSFLEHDSRWKFYQKNASRMRYFFHKWFKNTCDYFLDSNDASQMYHVFNMTSYNDIDWYLEHLKKNLGVDFYDCYRTLVNERNASSVQIYDYLPFSFANVQSPVIYVVDSVLSLKNNRFWTVMRDISRDIAVDINGNICLLSEVINGQF